MSEITAEDKHTDLNIKIQIAAYDKEAERQAKLHWDGIAKPLDGLGKLETLICRLAGITGSTDVRIEKRAVVVMCADNGIIEENVTQSSHEVTTIVSRNMAKGIASVCRMSKAAGIDVIPINIGIKDKLEEPGLWNRHIAFGTRNFRKEPAMSETQVHRAIQTGIQVVKELKEQGYAILATGEMGIGNTTTSSAIASVLLELPVECVTDKGAGLSKSGIERKIQVIQEGIQKYQLTGAEPLKVLQCVGGLDIAGLVGVYLGGACYRLPVVIDGVIAAVAALVAERLVPGVKDFMLPSHQSQEPAAGRIMEELGFAPVIHGDLSLGEGTGAILLLPMLDMALQVYRENTTFQDIQVAPYVRHKM